MHPMIRTCLTYLTTYWTFLPNFREQATHVIHLDSGDDVTVTRVLCVVTWPLLRSLPWAPGGSWCRAMPNVAEYCVVQFASDRWRSGQFFETRPAIGWNGFHLTIRTNQGPSHIDQNEYGGVSESCNKFWHFIKDCASQVMVRTQIATAFYNHILFLCRRYVLRIISILN